MLYATLFIFAGLIFYFPFVHYKKEIPYMGKLSEIVYFLWFIPVFPSRNSWKYLSLMFDLHVSLSNVIGKQLA